DAIKPGFLGVLRGPTIVGHDPADFVRLQSVRRFIRHALKVACERVPTRRNGGRRYRQSPLMERTVGNPTNMPELQKEDSASVPDSPHNGPPSPDLLLREDAEVLRVTLALPR